MQTTTKDILKEVTLLSSLNDTEYEELAAISHVSFYDKGATLFTQGDVCHYLMILTSGVVSIFKHDTKGNEIVIGYFHKYALLAEAATLRKTALPSTARFQSSGSILKIPVDSFEVYLKKHPKLAYEIIQSLLEKVDLLQQNIHFNLASTSKEKTLNFYQKNPKLASELKQYEIASLLGITPETLSRNITKLIKEKKLVQNTHGYTALHQS